MVGTLEIVGPAIADSPRQFYRAAEVPAPAVALQFNVLGDGSVLRGDGFRLVLTGLSGHGPSIIYASTNLTAWQPIFTNPPTVGTLQLVDWSATNRSLQFYRAVEQ